MLDTRCQDTPFWTHCARTHHDGHCGTHPDTVGAKIHCTRTHHTGHCGITPHTLCQDMPCRALWPPPRHTVPGYTVPGHTIPSTVGTVPGHPASGHTTLGTVGTLHRAPHTEHCGTHHWAPCCASQALGTVHHTMHPSHCAPPAGHSSDSLCSHVPLLEPGEGPFEGAQACGTAAG